MSQSQPPASSQAQEEIAELLNEIAFQKVLLSSIDDSVENREEAENEVRAEIKALEKQLKALKRGSRAPDSFTSSAPQDFEATSSIPPSSRPLSNSPMDDSPPGSPSNPNQAREHTSTASSPISADLVDEYSNSGSLTPSKMDLPTRKRSRSQHLDGLAPPTNNKSRRTSPSPLQTGATTPSSSLDDDEFPTVDVEFFRRQQKAEEERIERERRDEELARKMYNQGQQQRTQPAAAASGPSAFDRLSGMRPPPSSSSTTTSSSNPPHGQSSKGRYFPGLPSKIPGVKNEASSSSSRDVIHMLDFGHWDDSDDSDIEIISPDAFYDKSPRKPAGNTASRRVDQVSPNSALQMAMFGKQNVPKWMNQSMQGSPSQSARPSMNFPTHNPNMSMGPGMANGVRGTSQTPLSGRSVYVSPPLHNGGGLYGIGTSVGSLNAPAAYSPYGIQSGRPGIGDILHSTSNMGFGNMNQPGPSQGMSTYPSFNTLSSMYRPGDIRGGDDMPDMFNHPFNERMAGQLDYIMNDPRKTDEEIKALIENIRPDADLPAEDREGTPEGLKYPLYEHQKLALTWLKSMEEGTNKGGILADDMGLGKTISSLALILSRPSTDHMRKTTLIVGPVALVRQWEREIRKKVKPEHKLSTYMAHGANRKLSWNDLRLYDVVLTTYGTLAAEYSRWGKFLEEQQSQGRTLGLGIEEGPLRKKFPFLGPKSLFYRVILDEAQCIKNKSTLAARAACQLKSVTRICLTGTPMMNNVGELYSLIHFLRIRPYNEYKKFQEDFGMFKKAGAYQHQLDKGMRKLQALLKAILLRRTKTSLIDGKPIITLPPKTEETTHVIFSDDEKAFYDSLEGKIRIQFNKYMKAGTVGKNYSSILVLLLRLRQCCCHPHLITHFDEAPPAGAADLTEDVMIKLAESLYPDVVSRLLAAEGSFECPICYDGVENPSIIIPCGHDTCAECLTKISDQANQQNVADGNEAGGTSKCPSCRGRIDMGKIIDYATFKKVHVKGPVAAEEKTAGVDMDSDDDSESESDSETESEDDVDRHGDLRDFIVPDISDATEDEEDPAPGEGGDDEAEQEPKKKSKDKGKKKERKRHRKAKKGKGKESSKHLSIAMLKKEASKNADGRRRYMKYLRKHWQPSAKVNKCVELLERFQNEDQKTIVFSQFVSLLDLLQVPIDQKGWVCERYDGSMNAEARNDAINRFTDDRNTKIMLISLKAGNAGLNLVAASRVIILDPFWNPFIEMQAVDRAHRIGQQRPVEVHRILIKNTVEDRIIELQQRKKKLVDEALSEGASKSLGRLGVQELAFLFGIGTGQQSLIDRRVG